MAFLFLGLTIVAAWVLATGLRSREMSAMGVPYGRWRRFENPSLFWLAAAFNLMVLITGSLLFLEELRP